MPRRCLLSLLALSLLAGPLVVGLCVAGVCGTEPAAASHCAMVQEPAATAFETATVDCCAEVALPAPATAVHGPESATAPALLGPATALRPQREHPGRALEAAVARSGPGERLHALGALLL
jgi:hypothetical protein